MTFGYLKLPPFGLSDVEAYTLRVPFDYAQGERLTGLIQPKDITL
ncbi:MULTISPECIES: hypothetical protein [unclassified Sphingomonas]